jgi:hypothetical protein
MPANAVYVGRPTKWGNPFNITANQSRVVAIERYRWWLARGIAGEMSATPVQPNEIRELRGKDLACWCPLDQSCHADVLLELANAE